MKNNLHKKLTYEDKFIRKYYCDHAKENYIKFTKKYNNKKLRREFKKELKYSEESI